MGDVGRECRLDLILQLLVEHVALGDCQHPLLVDELGVETAQLLKQHLIFLGDVVGVGGDHEQQHGVTLDMAQEPQT